MERREFLKAAAAGAVVLTSEAVTQAHAEEAEARPRLKDAIGLLYDSTICVGCKACVAACKRANDMPPEFSTADKLWDSPKDLSAKTLNIIKVFKIGRAANKDVEDDGYAFIKRQCMHCVDPSCVSACPASAMTKNQSTGVVEYNKGNCIGCRYCMVACPYEIPKFEWDKALPVIRKCELCRHRHKDGKIAACAEVCPTGATIFGRTEDLLAEAKRRVRIKPGSLYQYPLNTASGELRAERPVAAYRDGVYGEFEVGGAQCLILSAVEPRKLGLPELPQRSYARLSEKIQHTIYKGMIAPALVFLGLLGLTYRNTRLEKKEERHDSHL